MTLEEAVKDYPELMLELKRLRKAKEQLDKLDAEAHRKIRVYAEDTKNRKGKK